MSEYIDRQSLINHLNQSAAEYYSRAVERVIELEPAADVAPVRRGHWIKRGYACGEAEFECSHCHEIEWRANETDYCPNCGAKMEAEHDKRGSD